MIMSPWDLDVETAGAQDWHMAEACCSELSTLSPESLLNFLL